MWFGTLLLIAGIVGVAFYADKRNKREGQATAWLAYRHFWPAWEQWESSEYRMAVNPMTGFRVKDPSFWDYVAHYASENHLGAIGYGVFANLIRESPQYEQMLAGESVSKD